MDFFLIPVTHTPETSAVNRLRFSAFVIQIWDGILWYQILAPFTTLF